MKHLGDLLKRGKRVETSAEEKAKVVRTVVHILRVGFDVQSDRYAGGVAMHRGYPALREKL